MKKYIIILFMSLLQQALWAQTGEVYTRLQSFRGSKTLTEAPQLSTTEKGLQVLDYSLGYNFFINESTYLGAEGAYIPVKSKTIQVNDFIIGRNEAIDKTDYKYYKLGLHMGKLTELQRFRLYSEVGVLFNWSSRGIVDNSWEESDTTGLVFYEYNNTTNLPKSQVYSLRLTQGVYYSLFAGLSAGIDINIYGSLTREKGKRTTTSVSTLYSVTSSETTSHTENNTFYNLGIQPSLGIRYTF